MLINKLFHSHELKFKAMYEYAMIKFWTQSGFRGTFNVELYRRIVELRNQ